ncbi:SanA/YdcF family protein [Allosalinactinospora lopnorensis]|uniref:SanA/YdcF family protein n=1 Tax=Allosalinactinospora lopnorensis TaxID=1352348 RepID=UPI000623FEDC|nr:ElyC/SanA/YdcF family protein [Allosalinactinospora lopnorensis]
MQPGVWAVAVFGLGTLLALVPTGWVYLASAGHRFNADSVPRRPVAIVLGAAAWPSGPSPLLARRLQLAARLYHSGRVRALLVSGDNRPESGFETDTMARRLVELEVPEEAIVADPHGYRTWDTCVRARDVFGADRAIVVTQSFHLPRTVALCRAAGVDAVGVGDPSLNGRSRSTVYGYLREFGANTKALRDAVARPAPTRTDPPADELRSALS